MKKLFLSAAAIGLLSGVAVAEPQKLDDQVLGDVAAGQLIPALALNAPTVTTTTTTMTSMDQRTYNQNLQSVSSNNNYAVGLASPGVVATGSVVSTIMGAIN